MDKILCVEDALDAIAILEATLKAHHPTFVTSVKQALETIQKEQFDLILMDIELPDGSGLEIVAELPEHLKTTPIVFLTGRKDFASKVSAFSLGADDFIVKPFDPRDLRLRVESKLRKAGIVKEGNEVLRVGQLICNLQEQRLYRSSGRDAINLTSLEFRIFHLLARTPNKVFSREEILDRVWGGAVAVTDRAVDVHVSNVRKKLFGTDVTIDAVIGSGYRILIEGTNL